MHDSQATALWHTANWLTLSAVFRFGQGRLRQRPGIAGLTGIAGIDTVSVNTRSDLLLSLADDVLTRQVILRSWLGNDHQMPDPAMFWAPVIILFQQTADLLHELHQQMLESSPLAFAPVIPALDRQVRAFHLNEDDPETAIGHFADNADRLIREMTMLKTGILGVIRKNPGILPN
jgi:hypothetical protein